MAVGTGISSNGGQGTEEYPQDIIPEGEECFSDTSSESESEDDVPLVPDAEQQRHGVLDDETRARRRLANAELDAHFASLRALLRTTIRGVPRDRYSIMMLANEHLMQLLRSIEDRKYQRDLALEMNSTPSNPLVMPSPQGVPFGMQIPRMGSIDGISHENPMVEVLRDPLRMNVRQLKLNIKCVNRSGLLIDLIAALDVKGLTVLSGSIVSRENDFLADLYLEKDNPVTPVDAGSEPHPAPRPEPLPESEEDEALKESVLCLIRQDISMGTSDSNSN